MRHRFAGSFLAVTLLLSCSGCMTLFAEKKQDVTFTCNVPGAKIRIVDAYSHYETEVDPGTVSLPRLSTATWSAKAPGYVENTGALKTRNNGWFTGLVVELVLTLGVGGIADIIACPGPSVPILEYEPTKISIELAKLSDPPAAPPPRVEPASPPPRPTGTPTTAAPPPKVESVPTIESIPAATGDTYVLAIGVNEYDDARIPKLHFAEQDARAVYGFYATSRRSPTAQDRVLLLAGKDATRTGILKAIREHLERKATRPGDTVVFYFGGHGFSDADDTYLAASDTQIDSLRETGLSSATLREYWTKIRAGRKVLIMDACHAGGIDGMRGTRGIGGVRIGDETAPGATPSATLVIAATGPNELSTEDTNLGHGVFTRVLLNGLAGEADENKDGHITGDELGKYLVREVPGVARGFGGNQTPTITQPSGGPVILLTR